MAISQSTPPKSREAQPTSPSVSAPRPTFKSRFLTVGDYRATERLRPGAKRPTDATRPSKVPFLRLMGTWLAEAGFQIGTKVRVDIGPESLHIETIPEVSCVADPRPHLPRTGTFYL